MFVRIDGDIYVKTGASEVFYTTGYSVELLNVNDLITISKGDIIDIDVNVKKKILVDDGVSIATQNSTSLDSLNVIIREILEDDSEDLQLIPVALAPEDNSFCINMVSQKTGIFVVEVTSPDVNLTSNSIEFEVI